MAPPTDNHPCPEKGLVAKLLDIITLMKFDTLYYDTLKADSLLECVAQSPQTYQTDRQTDRWTEGQEIRQTPAHSMDVIIRRSSL